MKYIQIDQSTHPYIWIYPSKGDDDHFSEVVSEVETLFSDIKIVLDFSGICVCFSSIADSNLFKLIFSDDPRFNAFQLYLKAAGILNQLIETMMENRVNNLNRTISIMNLEYKNITNYDIENKIICKVISYSDTIKYSLHTKEIYGIKYISVILVEKNITPVIYKIDGDNFSKCVLDKAEEGNFIWFLNNRTRYDNIDIRKLLDFMSK